MREMPGGDLVWVAENNQWGGPGGYGQPSFVHVFIGKKVNQLITGQWVDLPKGKASGKGSFATKLEGPQEITVNPSSGSCPAFQSKWGSN